MKTKHVGKHIPLSCPLSYYGQVFLYTVIAPRCIVSFKQATLKRRRDVAASLCHCYFGGDSLLGIIIQQRISGCATGVRCKSTELSIGDKHSLTARVQQTCLQNATAAQGSCSSVDISCLCSSALYEDSLACCLSKNCNEADQTGAQTSRDAALIVY